MAAVGWLSDGGVSDMKRGGGGVSITRECQGEAGGNGRPSLFAKAKETMWASNRGSESHPGEFVRISQQE